MKKNKKILILTILILIISILLLIKSNSYSKYVTEAKGNGVIDIANWSFLVNGEEKQIATINLAETIQSELNTNKIAENKIAPGTKGAFNIDIDATNSEVAMKYNITFRNITQAPENLEFTYNGITKNSITELEEYLQGVINIPQNNEDRDNQHEIITINWEWPFESGEDEKDTEYAREISEYKFEIIVSGFQLDPNT